MTQIFDSDMPAFKHCIRICDMSTFISSYIKVDTSVKSDLIYFEEIFFFYFLTMVSLSVLDTPSNISSRLSLLLLDMLKHDKKPGYINNEDDINKCLNSRYETYIYILHKHNNKLSPDFFAEAFLFQAVCLNDIDLYDSLLVPDLLPLPIQDWIIHISKKHDLSNFVSALNKHYKTILKFVLPKALKKLI